MLSTICIVDKEQTAAAQARKDHRPTTTTQLNLQPLDCSLSSSASNSVSHNALPDQVKGPSQLQFNYLPALLVSIK